MEGAGMSSSRFMDNLAFVLGIPRDKLPTVEAITEPTPVALVGVTVGELAHALRFTGLTITCVGDGVQIRRTEDIE